MVKHLGVLECSTVKEVDWPHQWMIIDSGPVFNVLDVIVCGRDESFENVVNTRKAGR